MSLVDEELGPTLVDGTSAPTAHRPGRRRRLIDEQSSGPDQDGGDAGDAPKKMQGGWGAAPATKGKAGKKGAIQQGDDAGDDEDDNAVIPIIPDLEEVQEEDMLTSVAAPPMVSDQPMQTLSELSGTMQRSLPNARDESVDLGLLQAAMVAQELVDEPDKEWTWTSVYTQLKNEMITEQEELEKQEAQDASPAAPRPNGLRIPAARG